MSKTDIEQAVEDGLANPLRSFASHLTAALGFEIQKNERLFPTIIQRF